MNATANGLAAALVVGLILPATQSFAGRPHMTTMRPIEDFVYQQGKFCVDSVTGVGTYVDEIVDEDFGNCPTGSPPVLLAPPIANFIGQFDPANERSASVDYAGLADYWAGGEFKTTFEGKVIERPLDDGRVLVEVLLQTSNALAWVVDGTDFEGGPLLFGKRAPEVLAGAEGALGSSFVQVKFINAAPGDPLPDLIQLLFFPGYDDDQELVHFGVRNRAMGPLRTLFGVPDGTSGVMTGVQTALFANPQCGSESPSAVADCFPAERIDLHVIGK